MSVRMIAASLLAATLGVPHAGRAQDAPAPTAEQSVAATAAPDIMKVNFFDLGLRATGYTDASDEARHQRYRDLRNGATLDAFRFSRDTATHWFAVTADHTGYRDQRYTASLNQFGRLKSSVEWNQTPLFFSRDTLTLYSSPSPGVLRIDDAIQRGIENKETTLAAATGQAVPFDMRLKRSVADFKLTYEATPHLDLDLTLKHTAKTGSQPWAGSFGFGNAVELAVPVDTRTTEVGGALEWSNQRGSARVGYDGSFFRNDIDTLVWDNPLRITDSPTAGPSQGRMSLWPDSSLNAGSAMGT
ncbi:MAG: MtrB/PioB family outer membrane beta-barrel protein, partial [Acidobacteriota bacterium]